VRPRDPAPYTILVWLRRAWHGVAGHPAEHTTDVGQLLLCTRCTAVWGHADVIP
jgi:hypothetical protein